MKAVYFTFLILLSLNLISQERFSLVDANNEFAINFYQQLTKENSKQNLCISPYSISEALAMTYHGAMNRTKKEMQQVLKFPASSSELNKYFSIINKQLEASTKNIELLKANSLWAQKNYTFSKEYINDLTLSYKAKVQEVDFKKNKNRKKSILAINNWVSQQTNGRITALINKNSISKDTRLILTNATYFNAAWKYEFDAKENRTEDFYAMDNTQRIEYMRTKNNFNYYYDDIIDALELPYAGNEQSMFILLPKKKDGIFQLEKTFDKFYLENILADKRMQPVVVTLPKFKTASDFELKKTFQNMGMNEAFSMSADFSGMTGKTDLFIDNIFHKTTINVSEKGTEASAATGVVMSRKSAMRDMVFMADHPFIYFIRDNKTGSILFIGRILSISNE